MEPQQRRRRRPALSCIECRRRKIKCNRAEPCEHCVSSKSQCTYRLFGASRVTVGQSSRATEGHSGLSSPLDEGSTARATEAAPNKPIIPKPRDLPIAPVLVATPITSERSSTHDEAIQAEPILGFHGLSKQPGGHDKASSASVVTHILRDVEDDTAHQRGLQGSQVFLYKTRALTSSHWMGVTPEFATIFDCWTKAMSTRDNDEGDEAKTIALQVQELVKKCKSLAKTMKMGRPSVFASWKDMEPPSRGDSDTMVALYFRYLESSYRILHRPTFWACYAKYWAKPDGVSLDKRLLILLVIAAGSSLYKCDNTEHLRLRKTAFKWVYSAQTWLSSPFEKDRLSITGLQIHCLTILIRQNLSIGGDLIWDSAGSLVQRAMQLNLHRDPQYLPAMPGLQAEVRRRLWATVLEIAVQSSLDSALPPRITTRDYDTKSPANVDDAELTDATMEIPTHPRHAYTENSLQCILSDSLSTRLKMVQLLNGLQLEIRYDDITSLSLEITNSIRESSKLVRGYESTSFIPFHRNLLDYLLRRFLIPFNSTFARKSRTNPLFHYSLTTALEASLTVVHPEPDEAFSRLMARGGGPYREGMMCASTAIGIELIAQTEARRLDGTLHRGPNSREILKHAIKELLSMAFERIQQQAETSTKTLMLLSMILAQAEAMEEDVDREVRILLGARDSLEQCHSLLQSQHDAVSPSYLNDLGFNVETSETGLEDFGVDWGFELLSQDLNFS